MDLWAAVDSRRASRAWCSQCLSCSHAPWCLRQALAHAVKAHILVYSAGMPVLEVGEEFKGELGLWRAAARIRAGHVVVAGPRGEVFQRTECAAIIVDWEQCSCPGRPEASSVTDRYLLSLCVPLAGSGPTLRVCYLRHAYGLGEHYNSVQQGVVVGEGEESEDEDDEEES